MFTTAISEALLRHFEAEQFFREAAGTSLEPIAKGFVFVPLYAAYEFSVCAAVQAAISAVNTLGEGAGSLRAGLLGIAFDAELTAVADTEKTKNKWDRRLKLFERLAANDAVQANDSVMPGAGGHYKVAHLQVIWRVFGIDATVVPEPRLLGFVDELVDNRNAVSHGRLTAKEVGRRYSTQDIDKRIADTKAVCQHVLQVMGAHCGDRAKLCR